MITDAPKDNMGEGKSFSPTDLVATALGTCILTTMGIVAQRNNIDMTGATAKVTKEMVTTPVRRIGRLATTIHMPRRLSEILARRRYHTETYSIVTSKPSIARFFTDLSLSS